MFKQSGCHGHAYKVSSPCVVPLASLRSEEVKVFVVVVVLAILTHAHQSFTSMRATVSKFGDFKEKCLRLFVVVVVMETMLHTCAKLPEAFSNNMRSSWKHVIVMEMI